MIERHAAVTRSYIIPGMMWPAELCWLYDTFSKSKVHAEVGTYCGRSLYATCGGMRKATIYAVDLDVPGQGLDHPSNTWTRTVLNATLEAIKFHSPDLNVIFDGSGSLQAARKLFGQKVKFDSVFIDGYHTYEHTSADILEWLPLMKPGGIISGHDYSTADPGVLEAVNEFLPGFSVVPNTRIWFKQV